MRSALLLAGVGVGVAVTVCAGWWFARWVGKVRRVESGARSGAVSPVSAFSHVSLVSLVSFLGTPAETELSDAEIDALPPELPAAPVRGRGRPAIPSVKV